MSETEIKNGIYTDISGSIKTTILSIDKIISDDIKTTEGAEYITKTRASELYEPRNNGEENKGNISYVPAQEQKIQFSLNEPYTVMMNGWFVVNPEVSDIPERWTISINERPMFYSDPDGNISASIMVYKGDIITSTTEYDRYAYFMPCASELYDWRAELLKNDDVDIWKNAIRKSDQKLTDQWLYNTSASNWNATYGETYKSTLSYINGDEAFKADGTDEPHLFYIQTENIKTGYNMFRYCYSLESFNGDLSSLTDGNSMFRYCNSLESFNNDLSSLTDGYCMFYKCSELGDFNGDLSSLSDGRFMFGYTQLTQFENDFSNLKYGKGMFQLAKTLTSFKTNTLKKLEKSNEMFFDCMELDSFTVDDHNLSSLTDGTDMFYSCDTIKSFYGNLSSLENGDGMFQGCPSFTSFGTPEIEDEGETKPIGLPCLESGETMFSNCKLDEDSVNLILSTIPTHTDGEEHKLSLGVGHNTYTDETGKHPGTGLGAIISIAETEGITVTIEPFNDSTGDYYSGNAKFDGEEYFDYKGWKIGVWCGNWKPKA